MQTYQGEDGRDEIDRRRVVRFWQDVNGTAIPGFMPYKLILKILMQSRESTTALTSSLSNTTLEKIAEMSFDLHKKSLLMMFGGKLRDIFITSWQDGRLDSSPHWNMMPVSVNIDGNWAVEVETGNLQSWIRMEVMPNGSKLILRIGGVCPRMQSPTEEDGRVFKLKSGEEFKGFGYGTFRSTDGSRTCMYHYKHMEFPEDIGNVFKIIKAVVYDTYKLPMNRFPARRALGPDQQS